MPAIIALRPGKHRDSSGIEREFSAEDLKATAQAYDTSLHEAPIVIGHPKHDAPAYGWVKGARFEGDELKLEGDELNPDFVEMRRSGAFKKHSIALYTPDDPRNPKPGVWYPRHIGFLGAMAPAIKGLPQAEFSDEDQPVTIEFAEVDAEGLVTVLRDMLRRMREFVIEKFSREDADEVIPDWQIEDLKFRVAKEPAGAQFSEEVNMDPNKTDKDEQAALAARQAELEAREAKLAADETKRAAAEAEQRRADATAFAEALADQGRILPRHIPTIVELQLAQPDEEVEFAEGDKTRKAKPDELLRGFLESLPEQIQFAEKSGGPAVDTDALTAAELGKQARKVVAKAKAEGVSVSYTEAVDEVLKGAQA